ncbi:MAG: CotH kinase family protein [Verrucomicrobiota bacterium]
MTIIRNLLISLLLQTALCHGSPVISEFAASNGNGIKDEDDSRQDWIEIRNPDAVAVNLENWCLSDTVASKAKWRFPAVTIPANGHLIVFASNKDRAIAGQPLHTNFALSAGGEYLGLTMPDGATTVSEYTPKFPAQYEDISYGIPYTVQTSTPVQPNASAKWRVPTSVNSVGSNWTTIGFADGAWNTATMGLGFDPNGGSVNYLPEIGSGGNLQTALQNNAQTQTCYVRIPFTAPAGVVSLKLRVKYDDGFAAWMNGQPLMAAGIQLKRNAPNMLDWTSRATQTHNDAQAIVYQEFDVSENIPALLADNLLAFQFLNERPDSSDALFRVELVATVANIASISTGYFAAPTPGSLNGGIDTLVIPRKVTFSKAQGVFGSSFSLTLGGAVSGEEIRYTLDGSVPSASSPVYTAPLTVASTQLVRARLRNMSDATLGLLASAHYEYMEGNLSNYSGSGLPFKSALPILVLNNLSYSGEFPNDDVDRDIRVHLYDRDASGYASLGGIPVLSSPARGKIRGSSSADFPKKPYSLEFTNEYGGGTDATLLGLKGEDFALIPCYSFDRTFVRNAWIYEIARQSGHWAPQTRLVEVFFNQNNSNLSYDSGTAADYRGVYQLTEVIRPDSDRVDITKMNTSDTTLPGISGGLIMKIDRKDADEFSWLTSRNLPPGGMVIYRPKLADLNSTQTNYIIDYFQDFENALYTEQAAGFPTRNYQKYINPLTWADHNLLNMFPKNVDGLRLSAYFHKDRGRPVEGGSLWDFDRSANNDDTGDNRDADPTQWYGTGDGTPYFEHGWWDKLFKDIEFRQLYVDRWHTLRRGPLLNSNIYAVINTYYNEFRSVQDSADHPAKRDYSKWYAGNGNLTNYTNSLKSWIASRITWIDSQFTPPTSHSLASGPVTAGTGVSVTIPSGTRVYYTLDGTDPRAVNGGISPGAVEFTGGSIPLNQTTLLTSRAFRTGSYAIPATNWSGPLQSLYTINEAYAANGNLLVTGIHFNPAAPTAAELVAMPEAHASDFSWIEIRNSSGGPINLAGMSLVKTRPVSAVTLTPRTLAPGEKGLIVKNRVAFTTRYGSGPASKIVAEWPGDRQLDPLEADMRLLAKDGTTQIANFTYETQWIGPVAAAEGKSMEYISTQATSAAYETAVNWRASEEAGGSPGELAPEGYLAWQQEEFPGETVNIGSLDDFDLDGIANLIEYLLGSDPKIFTSYPGTVVADSEDGLVLDYTCRADRTDATLSVWQSTGLDLWIPAASDERISTDGVIQHRRASFPTGGKGFLRFKGVAN